MATTPNQKKILLVEDDVFMLELLVTELTQAGFNVAVAKTGIEAVTQFSEAHPDIILLDIILPDENGFEALRQIRRKEGGVETKVVVLSNLSDEADKEEAKRLGAIDYMVKAHYSLPEIVQKVRTVLEK